MPVDHYDIEAYGFRVEGDRVLAYSGDSGPCDALGELARDADLLLCEATLEQRRLDGAVARAPRARRGRRRPRPDAARSVAPHAPSRTSGRAAGLELAYDGLELEL